METVCQPGTGLTTKETNIITWKEGRQNAQCQILRSGSTIAPEDLTGISRALMEDLGQIALPAALFVQPEFHITTERFRHKTSFLGSLPFYQDRFFIKVGEWQSPPP